MIKRVRQFMEKYHMVPENKKILVGFSGGADSVCLMEILRELANVYGLSLYAVHVHHGIRGETADVDAAFAEEYCKTWNIPFKICYVSVPKVAAQEKISTEEAGRLLRYRIFAEMKAHWQADAIAVAHHRNDQAETVLFQIARGSGLTGAGGIRPVQKDIIRPLLCLNKEEIVSFLTERGVLWREDESNQDTVYTRNCIRGEILPLLKEHVNGGCVEHIAALALKLQETENYLKGVEQNLWDTYAHVCEWGIKLEVQLLREAELFHPRLILRAIETQSKSRKDITNDHVEMVRALLEASCGKQVNLPNGVLAWREKNSVCIGRQIKHTSDAKKEIELQIPSRVCVGGETIELCIKQPDLARIPQNKYTKWFDYDRIKGGLTLRKRRPQDIIGIDDQGHHKSLKRFMIDQKIPQHIRDDLWVIADESAVLWLIGERIGADYKVTEKTSHVLEIKITGENENER